MIITTHINSFIYQWIISGFTWDVEIQFIFWRRDGISPKIRYPKIFWVFFLFECFKLINLILSKSIHRCFPVHGKTIEAWCSWLFPTNRLGNLFAHSIWNIVFYVPLLQQLTANRIPLAKEGSFYSRVEIHNALEEFCTAHSR